MYRLHVSGHVSPCQCAMSVHVTAQQRINRPAAPTPLHRAGGAAAV